MPRLLLALWLMIAAVAQADPLPVDQAFDVAVRRVDDRHLQVDFAISPGYYLYRDRLGLQSEPASVSVAAPAWPAGETKNDPSFGKVQVYHQGFGQVFEAPPGDWTLLVRYQGCADAGLCYPPQVRRFAVTPTGVAAAGGDIASRIGVRAATPFALGEDESARIARAIGEDTLFITLLGFFAAGMLLALTPCVLPMVPILSGIIVGQGEPLARRRAFLLSLTYVVGMACTYAIAGIAAGMSGVLLSSVLQSPWVLASFGMVFVALALSMFGLFDLQLPGALQGWAANVSNRLPGGRFTGAGLMGSLSALIVGPCIAPPLAGALLFISRSGDVALGGAALFALAIGMGLPLLVVGTSAGALLSRASRWFDRIRLVFGVVLLGLAIWIVSPVWLPVVDRLTASFERSGLRHERVSSLAELDAALASAGGRPVMLDFTADWCSTCRELDRKTFSDPAVQRELRGWRVLRADVTASTAADRQMLARFGLFGPPAVVLFGTDGLERRNARVLNFQTPQQFLASLHSVRPQP